MNSAAIKKTGQTIKRQISVILFGAVFFSRLAFADIDYDVASGDYNSDGVVDILLLAKDRIVIIRYDVIIPITLASELPTVAFVSTCALGAPTPCTPSSWLIDTNLNQSEIDHSSWDFTTYEIIRADIDGDGKLDFFVRPLLPDLPSFLFFFDHAESIVGGSLYSINVDQIISVESIGIGLGEPGVVVSLEDRNGDGYLDLVVERNGILVGIFLRRTGLFQRTFVLPFPQGSGSGGTGQPDLEADQLTIGSIWGSFQSALLANDLQLVGQFFTEDSRDRYVALFQLMGSAMSSLPGKMSEFTAIDISAEIAIYAYNQSEANGDRLHTITFVREPGFGWRIQTF